MDEINNLPKANASWNKILEFAKTFDAYKTYGSLPVVADIANKKISTLSSCSIEELRAALFFEYRRYNHFGYDPNTEEMKHIHTIIEAIRAKF